MEKITQVLLWDDEGNFHEKFFTTLELANAWLEKNYPNVDTNPDDNDGLYEIHEHEVIKELD